MIMDFSFMSVLASVGLFFALGLSLYAIYMPMATGAQGSWGDCTTIAGFLKHLLRQEYGTFVLHPDMTSELSMVDRIRLYVGSIVTELPRATQKMFILLIIFGSVVSILARGHAGRVIALMWLTYVIVFHALSNLDLEGELMFEVHRRFWMQPNVVVFTSLGIGCSAVGQILLKCIMSSPVRNLFSSMHDVQRSVAVFSVLTIVVASFLLGYSIPLRENFAVMDQSKNTVLQDTFKDQLLAMPQNAMVLLRGDHVTNVMRYLQIVEGVRPDLSLLATSS